MVNIREIERREKRGEWEVSPPETSKNVEENLEIESWITKIEKRFARIPKGTPGPQDDNVVITQPQSQQPPVNLPVTQQQIIANKKGKASLSITWLVTWAIRQIRLLTKAGRKIQLRDIPEISEELKNDKL